MQWTWDSAKAAANRTKHRVSFEAAILALDDPLALSQPDPHPDGDRWQTIGELAGVPLLVVHTWPDEGETGRIISERRAYEERN